MHAAARRTCLPSRETSLHRRAARRDAGRAPGVSPVTADACPRGPLRNGVHVRRREAAPLLLRSLLLAAFLLLAACGGGGRAAGPAAHTGPPQRGGEVTVLENASFAGGWPTGLDPATNTTGGANIAQ